MASFGVFLSSEEHPARALVEQARAAETAGFDRAWISDHYHPWNDEQGQSPFVWSVLGGIAAATERLHVTTAVTCPTIRIHPAIIAQAAATAATMLPGRFTLGVGSGEALNEHVLGDRWPPADERLEMLEEAVEVIRLLWMDGVHSFEGRFYVVEHARIYSRPDTPPDVLVSGFGPKAISCAARIADGFITVGPGADGLRQYRDEKGRGIAQTGLKVCWGEDEAACVDLVHRLWPNEGLPGELPQVLPTPEHFEQATQLVTREMIAEQVPCGPDADRHAAAIQEHVDAGFDEVYINQIGPDQQGFLDFYTRELLPRLR
jgi:G6PDH family F420-dependent oxidoreductase